MKGGVILFRGTGADALRYLESDRSRADEYYLEAGTAPAEFTAVDAEGRMIGEVALTADEYRQWVDWTNPLTGESMGKPRLPADGRHGSPRFAEMVVNVPKSLSVAAALQGVGGSGCGAARRRGRDSLLARPALRHAGWTARQAGGRAGRAVGNGRRLPQDEPSG